MATATIFNKTLTAGDSKAVVLEPGSELLRETNFPANWLKIRIGLIGSWTNLVDNNGTPNAETVVGVAANPKTSLVVGMSNGVSYFGTAGNRFIGTATDRNGESASLRNFGSSWGVGNSGGSLLCGYLANIGDGTTLTQNSSTAINSAYSVGNPTAASACLFAMVWQLDLTLIGAGRVTVTKYSSEGTPIGNASDVVLNNLLNATALDALGSAASGGWWNQSGSTPNDCRFLSIRAPFTQNRLVLHNIMLQQYL
jgi:hypothetical protein